MWFNWKKNYIDWYTFLFFYKKITQTKKQKLCEKIKNNKKFWGDQGKHFLIDWKIVKWIKVMMKMILLELSNKTNYSVW